MHDTSTTHNTDWKAQSLRLTAFLSPSAQVGEQDWWKVLTGELPDSTISQPKIGVQKQEGKFKSEKIEGQLVLSVQISRIDWQLTPLDMPESGFPTIGLFSDAMDSFSELMQRWLEIAPPIQRLALGAVLRQNTINAQEGYENLSKYLTFRLDKDSSEFLYRINRPRKSQNIADLLINRLSTWSVDLLAGFVLSPNEPIRYSLKPAEFALSLELDINTSADFSGELTPDKSPEILQELVNLSQEIAEEGDIK
jgi:hypothetical protein